MISRCETTFAILKRKRIALAQRFYANQHPIVVGIKKFTGIESNATKGDGNITVANTFFDALLRVSVEGAYSDVDAIDVNGVADAAIHNDAFPAIFVGENGQLITDQCAAHGAATVDDQHLAFAVFGKGFADQRVVFKNFQCDDLAGKSGATTVPLEHRGDDADGFAEFGFEFIAKIGCFEGHAGLPGKKKPCIAWLVEIWIEV